MNLAEHLHKEKENPFHFYIISGNTEKNKIEVFSFLENDLNLSVRANPDVHQFSGLQLLISDARKIKSINSRTKNSDDSFRIFIIDVKKVDKESQNALLKTLEEPSHNTIFFLLLPSTDFILDTIISRGRVIKGYENDGSKRAVEFLKSSYIKRDKIVIKISKFSKEPTEVREDYLSFLSEIEIEILENRNVYLQKISIEDFSDMYKKFLDLKKQAGQRGSSLKYIMTFLAIDIPVLMKI
jgi:DNA polymerase III delta prime subunit